MGHNLELQRHTERTGHERRSRVQALRTGATWTLADGTQTPGNVNAIPDIPAHSVVIDPNDSQRIVGTDLGVFVSLDNGAELGARNHRLLEYGGGSLSAVNNNGVTTLFAFTHGRGAFKVTIPTSCATVSPTNLLSSRRVTRAA